jgi:hypothetical protein
VLGKRHEQPRADQSKVIGRTFSASQPKRRPTLPLALICLLTAWCASAHAINADQPATQDAAQAPAPAAASVYGPSDAHNPSMNDWLAFLPPAIRDGLDVHVWGWAGYLHDSQPDYGDYWTGELALDITKSLSDRLAISADVNFIDDNNHVFGQIEQAFGTLVLFPDAQTLLTVGKFNANFGVEPRDYWNRLTGTTGLLFGAQPQDLLGIMLTQSLGETGIKFRPFIVDDFQGRSNFDQPPSAGLTIEYKPNPDLTFAVTNWVGPGFVSTAAGNDAVNNNNDNNNNNYWSYYPSPYASGDDFYSSAVVAENWLGPDLNANRGGTLYFVEGRATWQPRPDLTLAVEALLATTNSSSGPANWSGAMVLANYDFTDRLRGFGRWSFLNDPQGLVTGIDQRRNELSGGLGFTFVRNLELRLEYRHDFARGTNDVDSVSANLSFGF